MSHFSVLIIGPNIKKQLDPFYEYGEGHDEDHKKWDWYQVGGRWCGFFPLKAGVSYELRKLGEPRDGVDITWKGESRLVEDSVKIATKFSKLGELLSRKGGGA